MQHENDCFFYCTNKIQALVFFFFSKSFLELKGMSAIILSLLFKTSLGFFVTSQCTLNKCLLMLFIADVNMMFIAVVNLKMKTSF